MRNDLSQLAAFAVVAEQRSFTRGAARLGISQSALSHSMSALETRLGIQLLARTTRTVSPTAAGRALLEDLKPTLERVEQSLAQVYRCEFEKGRKKVTVNPRGPVTFDDSDLVIQAVLKGVGGGMALEASLSGLIAKGG